MDDLRFDHLTRALTERLSRRGVGGLGGGVLSVLGLSTISQEDSGAKKKKRNKKKTCKKKKCADCRGCKMVRKGKKGKKPKCKPQPDGTACSAGRTCQGGACLCPTECCSNADCTNPATPECGAGHTCVPCSSSSACGAGALCHDAVCQPCDVTCTGDATACGDALQAELNALAPAGTLYVCPGRYKGNFSLTQAATLIGAGEGDEDAANTILDAGGSGRPLAIEAGAGAVTLRQMHITGGSFTGPGNPGGGIEHVGTTLTMTDCTVANNTTIDDRGGGIFVGLGRTLVMKHCTVRNNHVIVVNPGAAHGGGISCSGTLFLTNCRIEDNEAGQYGGGIWVGGDENQLDGGTLVQGNRALAGGGIYALGTLKIDADCRVQDNTAPAGNGGGILKHVSGTVDLAGPDPSPIVVNNCFENCAGGEVLKCAPGGSCP